MVLPLTYGAALALIVVSMLCWGSWANTFKLAGKWRFELFYFDDSLGVLLSATAFAYRALEAGKAAQAAKQDAAQGTRKTTGKGIALSLLSGVLMGSFFPLVEMGKSGPLGLGPYAIGFVFALGVFVSTFVFNVFF